MNNRIVCRMKPYIQPFEQQLAIAELEAMAGAKPVQLHKRHPEEQLWQVETPVSAKVLAERLVYFKQVTQGDTSFITKQVRNEATVNVSRKGAPLAQIRSMLPFKADVPMPNRRCLRYGTHGIHEYRGKFFPQLVRSLMNLASISPSGTVLDPMCGSGTTIVEGVLAGCKAFGLDMNPLSALMSRTKFRLLFLEVGTLVRAYDRIRKSLLGVRPRTSLRSQSYYSTLPTPDREYLERWFAPQVLGGLDTIAVKIVSIGNDTIRDFMWVCLSNILRNVSWQKNEDLRIRKEVREHVEIDVIREFLEEIGRSVRAVVAFLCENKGVRLGKPFVQEGDARNLSEVWPDLAGHVDAVITSPPYATALPYIDTDRLSLCYLKLLSRPGHRALDKRMIGNREITQRVRWAYLERLRKEAKELPKSITRLVGRIGMLNSSGEAGFRRLNLPSLLAKYFMDMRQVLAGVLEMLRPGAPAYVVVGNNHTIAGGTRVDIETANLLAEIASGLGFEEGEHLSMDMLVSREIFSRNAVASEVILELRKPA